MLKRSPKFERVNISNIPLLAMMFFTPAVFQGCNSVEEHSSTPSISSLSDSLAFQSMPSCLSAYAGVVGLSHTRLSISGNGVIRGKVVLLGDSILHVSGNAKVMDSVYARSSSQVTMHGNASVGEILLNDFTSNEGRLLTWIDYLERLEPTHTYDRLTETTQIIGNGGLNVIQVKNGIQLSGSSQLQIVGSQQDQFVFVVENAGIHFSGAAGVSTQGSVSSRKILFLALGGNSISITGQGSSVGTWIAPRGSAKITGKGKLEGAIVAQQSIQVSGNGFSLTPSAWCPEIQVPMPTASPDPEPSTVSSPSVDPDQEDPAPEPGFSPTPTPIPVPTPSGAPTCTGLDCGVLGI